jgi:hypothetical protein
MLSAFGTWTPSSWLELRRSTNGVVLLKAIEQDFGVHQIGRVKPLAKPAIERGQQVDTLVCRRINKAKGPPTRAPTIPRRTISH